PLLEPCQVFGLFGPEGLRVSGRPLIDRRIVEVGILCERFWWRERPVLMRQNLDSLLRLGRLQRGVLSCHVLELPLFIALLRARAWQNAHDPARSLPDLARPLRRCK